MLHGPEERKYLRSDIKNPQNPGKEYFSIIAFSSEVTGIDEEGFSYSLKKWHTVQQRKRGGKQ